MVVYTKFLQMKIQDFLQIEIKEGIATLWLDNKKEKMNVVSPAVIGFFGDIFRQIEEDESVKAAIFISGKKDFMAGADIRSFAIEKEGEFRPFQKAGHQTLDKIEKSSKPFIAAIHGTCFGLGTELSLACHARIATNHPSTKFGLPEVKVGILPGGGGTQRLPRLIGIQKALDVMLTGKNIYAGKAKKIGLVDELTYPGKLHQAATLLAKRILKTPIKKRKTKKTLPEKLLENNPIGRSILFNQARKMALRQSQGNYPAIPAIIDCVETGIKKGLKAGYEKELEWFEKLMLTPESKALRSLFFASTDNKKNPIGKEKSHPLSTLGMIGAGFMGAGITDISVNNGINVLLKDIRPEGITAAKKEIWKGIQKKLKRRALSQTQAEEIIGRISGQLDYTNFDKADIVIEAVLEKMDLKKRIIEDIHKNCRKDVIIATNTSSLSVTEMAEHAQHPERVIGMHYFSPVTKMPLLEIVKTTHTTDEVIASCYEFGLQQGKTCIIVKDSPGFYVNRILAPYMNESLLLIDEGIKIETIDRAMKKKGFPVGPITLFDQVGLDIAAHVVDSSKKIVADRKGFQISDGVIKMYEAGRMGRKNRKGFYQYDEKGRKKKVDPAAYSFFEGNGTKKMDIKTIQNRCLLLMVNEAVLCLQEGIIANPVDGDLGAVFGTGFLPFTGGPFRYIDHLGIEKMVQTMNELAEKFGPKFEPADLLVQMAKTNKKFH